MDGYVAEPHEDCTCRWVNYSEFGGWIMTTLDLDCPVHGDWRGR